MITDMVRGSGLGRRGEASAPTCWKFTASLLQAASKWTIIYFCWSSSMDSLLELDPITLHWKAVFCFQSPQLAQTARQRPV